MQAFIIKQGEFALIVFTHNATDEIDAEHRFEKLGAKSIDLGKGRWLRKDPPHVPGCQEHLHAYLRKGELFSLNADASAHHSSHGVQIPRAFAEAIEKHFPGWGLPPNGRIASVRTAAVAGQTDLGLAILQDARDNQKDVEMTSEMILDLDSLASQEEMTG